MTCRNWLTLSARRSLAGAAAVAVVFALAIGWSPTARANEADVAAGFVRNLREQAIVVITANELSDAQRTGELRRLLISNFEVDLIGRFALGPHWKLATEAERDEYARLFQDFIVVTYASRLARYFGETMSIKGARLEGKNFAIVDSRMGRDAIERIAIEWHLRRDDAGWRVVDLVIEGISMAVTQRSEFAAVIRTRGGRIESLLAAMRQRTARP